MDPGKKESILGDIRIANRLIESGRTDLAIQLIRIVVLRSRLESR